VRLGIVFSPSLFGGLDIDRLRTLLSAAQKDHLIGILAEVDPVPWSNIDSQFVNPITHRTTIAQVPLHHSIQPDAKDLPRLPIADTSNPVVEAVSPPPGYVVLDATFPRFHVAPPIMTDASRYKVHGRGSGGNQDLRNPGRGRANGLADTQRSDSVTYKSQLIIAPTISGRKWQVPPCHRSRTGIVDFDYCLLPLLTA
jgi:hypothetical protein